MTINMLVLVHGTPQLNEMGLNEMEMLKKMQVYAEWVEMTNGVKEKLGLDGSWRALEKGKFMKGGAHDYHKQYTEQCFTPWNEFFTLKTGLEWEDVR